MREVTNDRLVAHDVMVESNNTPSYFVLSATTTPIPRIRTRRDLFSLIIRYLTVFFFAFTETCDPNNNREANSNIVLSGTNGTINSPLFPSLYMKCRWKITVPSGHRIKLSFSVFHLGATGAQKDCEKVDHVMVRDGYNENDPAYGTFCGNVAPSPIFSVGPKIEITFVSDQERVFQGFSARFESISGGELSTLVKTIF